MYQCHFEIDKTRKISIEGGLFGLSHVAQFPNTKEKFVGIHY